MSPGNGQPEDLPEDLPDGLLATWYGDDFTGAAAVMEVLAFAGLPAVLFLDIPTTERLARFAGLRAIGIAGHARAKSPEWMAEYLPPIFAALGAGGAPILHYKICSTLDSAPHVGSIGAAADLALGPGDWAPVLAAAPAIGRWQAFGNLFARAGAAVERLDRHPTMSVHPVTPMREADVRRHLAAQTDRGIGLVDLAALKAGRGEATLASERARGRSLIALDVVDEQTLAAAGALVWRHAAGRDRPLFVIGSQGVEYALVAAFRQAGLLPPAKPPRSPGPVRRVAAVSASCAPQTAEQIRHAEAHGFAPIRLDAETAVDAEAFASACGKAVDAALAALDAGRDPIVLTAMGPDDPAIGAFRAAVRRCGAGEAAVNARLGAGLGKVLAGIVRRAGLTRAAVAGGDTSGAATGALGLWALTAEASIAAGAPLLKGHGDEPAFDGIEIALKGGQMGPPDFFVQLRAGGPGDRQ